VTCRSCGAELGRERLSCPLCQALVHAEELTSLAAQAEEAAAQGDPRTALVLWRNALELLPPDAGQAAKIRARIAELSRPLEAEPPSSNSAGGSAGSGRSWKGGGVLGGLGLLLWKLKAVLLLALTKGKLLFLGLSNAGTLFSMLLSMGVYWTVFGWRLAVLLILSIYVHEMGHVAEIRRLGMPAGAPMFIPGFGALIRLRQHPASPQEDARIGLAGPIWGAGAAVAAYGASLAWGSPLFAAVARWGAWVNLFNLLPVWQLDGGRAFHALSRAQRLLATAALLAAWWLTKEGLLGLLAVVAAFRAWKADGPTEGDRGATLKYLFLVVLLSLLCTVHVPLGSTADGR
jgi:Zn-dependent protease